MTFFIYVGYVLIFSTGGVRCGAYAKMRKWVDGATAVLFAAAGLGLIRSTFSR